MVFGFRDDRRPRPSKRRVARRVLESLERRDLMALVVGPLSFEQDVPFNGPVATFEAGDVQGSLSNFKPTITWGDGSTASNAVIVPNGPTAFDVVASKTYGQFGTFPVTVLVEGADNSSVFQTADAQVADAPLTPSAPTAFVADAGQVFNGPIGSFQDVNSASVPGDFSVRIDWGDGQTSIGSVSTAATGQTGSLRYNVIGSHLYAAPGNYGVKATIVRTASGQRVATNATANVLAQPITARGLNIDAIADSTFQGPVATFTDSNPASVPTDFNATINWGTGQPTTGTIVKTGVWTYEVRGDFTYSAPGSFPIAATIKRVGGGGSATAQSVANVAPRLTEGAPVELVGTAGRQVSGVLAKFQAGESPEGASDYSATIDWGDGQTSPGVVAAVKDSKTEFTVSGAHEYATAGLFPARVTIVRSTDGRTLSTETPIRIYAFAGGLDPLSLVDRAAGGGLITDQQQPILSGTAEPRSSVRLSMRWTPGGDPIFLGQTMADASGRWSMIVGPMAERPFYLYGNATPTSGSPLPTTLLNGGEPIIVDLHPARPLGASLNARATRAVVMVGGGRSGVEPIWLNRPDSYTLIDAEGRAYHPTSVRAARASRLRPGVARPVVLSFPRTATPPTGDLKLNITSPADPTTSAILIASLNLGRGRR